MINKISKRALTVSAFLLLQVLAYGCIKEFDLKTPARIQSRIEKETAEFEKCYAKALERNRDAAGDVAVILNIEADTGSVSSVGISRTDIDDDEFIECIRNTAMEITLLPPPNVPVEGHYTLNFLYRE